MDTWRGRVRTGEPTGRQCVGPANIKAKPGKATEGMDRRQNSRCLENLGSFGSGSGGSEDQRKGLHPAVDVQGLGVGWSLHCANDFTALFTTSTLNFSNSSKSLNRYCSMPHCLLCDTFSRA